MSNKRKTMLALAGIVLSAAVILQLLKDAASEPPGQGEQVLTDPHLLEGKRLSETHCAGCHKYPDPGLLPWKTWRFETLNAMAPFLGINSDGGTAGSGQLNEKSSNRYLPDNVYPSGPQVTQKEWQKIRDYYLQTSPKVLLPAAKEPEITEDSLFFRARYPKQNTKDTPQVTSVRIDPGNRMIYLGDSGEGKFMVFNAGLERIHHSDIDSPISHIQILNNDPAPGFRNLLFTFMGYYQPSDAPYGSVASGWFNPDLKTSGIDSVLVTDIARPVQSQQADFNQNGLKDLLVNEFGHRAGSLFWLENRGEGVQLERRSLIDTPGCIQSHVLDFTGNNNPDVLALCTQASQRLYLFSNRGDGTFDRKTLLYFEVTAGSSSFELHDFNDDGHPDILYTSGDNADYSKILKPYHGVYIYLNDGKDQFFKEWFYPINGAYNAKARDFDGDGFLDLAVISYFADYENSPEEGFVFFKNNGDLTFTPYHHPAAAQGRWITMDVADFTGNGRDDIILANYPEGPMQLPEHIHDDWKEGPYFLLLENQPGKND